MLQSSLVSEFLGPVSAGRRKSYIQRNRPVSAHCGKDDSPVEMKRRIEELLLLGEFNAAVGTLLDPEQVCSVASSWLQEVAGWNVRSLIFAEGDQLHGVGDDAHVSEFCPGSGMVSGAAAEGPADEKSVRRGKRNDIELFCGLGRLTVSRPRGEGSQYSDEFVAGIVDTLARSLANAREYARLRTLSMRDHLTGLYNRRVFEAMLEVEARKRTPAPFSLLLIDLDNFKGINDTFGHGTGDAVLVSVAEMLRLSFRKADVTARYGGEEFAVLLPEASLDSATRTAERFRRNLAAEPLGCGDGTIRPTVSVGIATVSDRTGLDVVRMVEEADRALYRAKSGGKNRVCGTLLERQSTVARVRPAEMVTKVREVLDL